MKSSPRIHKVQFSFKELPANYPYRYTLYFILQETWGESARKRMMEQLYKALGIGKRGFEQYLYAKRGGKHYFLSEKYQQIIAQQLGIKVSLLSTPVRKPQRIKKAS